ncbi:hypothetical protein Bca101_056698 [Brassica carinata]
MEGSWTIARKTWELENNIAPHDSSSDVIFYSYYDDDTAQSKFQQEKPWANDSLLVRLRLEHSERIQKDNLRTSSGSFSLCVIIAS